MNDWKFYSTWEQRNAFRKECPNRLKTFEECEIWCKKAAHIWRGTKTFFRPEPRDDYFIILQGLEGLDK